MSRLSLFLAYLVMTLSLVLPVGIAIAALVGGWMREDGVIRCDDYLRVRASGGAVVVPSTPEVEHCVSGDSMMVERYPRQFWESPRGDGFLVTTQRGDHDLSPTEPRGRMAGVWFSGAVCRVNLERGTAPSQVVGRTRDLERMLRNLVENALRHANQGGIVEVRSQHSEKAVEIVVTDDGPGVAADDRERIFEPFYRAPDARAIAPDGSGLGLAIAREIARAHSGDITLAPPAAVVRGARFVVRLPLPVSAEL